MLSDDHNAAKWLAVVYRREGWYVIRVCPCHLGEPVTLAYPSKGRADHARRVMLKASDTNTEGKADG